MTPQLTGDSQPLSLITLEALYDIGYEVNLAEAESYTLALGRKREMRPGRGRVIDLRNDILAIPIRLLRVDPRRVK